jgi:lipid-binding SYLF domain-containing protein
MNGRGLAIALAATALLLPTAIDTAWSQEPAAQELEHGQQPSRQVMQTIETFLDRDPGMKKFFEGAAGYAVFPSVGAGAFIIGGAHGKGQVISDGVAIGETSITKVTVGLQAGGQEYSEVIFLETEEALDHFTGGNFELSAQVSAVMLANGAAANASYRDGVAVFVHTKTGVMAEASVGGQGFSYKAY